MSVELTIVISIACTILGAIVGVSTFVKNGRKDAAVQAKGEGIVASELGYIKAGVDDIKRKQETHDKQYLDVIVRLTKVEASYGEIQARLNMTTDGKY